MEQLRTPTWILIVFMAIMSGMSMWIKFQGVTKESDSSTLKTMYMCLGISMLYLVIIAQSLSWGANKPEGRILQIQAMLGIALSVVTIWMLWYGDDIDGTLADSEFFTWVYNSAQSFVMFGSVYCIYQMTRNKSQSQSQ